MAGPIVYVDRSRIRDGRLEDVRAGIAELAAFVEANEPQIVSYSVFLDEATSRMTVIHVHADPASLAFHMQVAGPMFARFVDMVALESIDVYGDPGDDVMARLRDKAEMLGSGVVTAHPFHAGFLRTD